MKRTLSALCAIAAMTAASAGVASAQDIHVGPGGVGIGPDHAYRDRGENCRVVITHRRGLSGNSITVRRRVCD